jgi:hypothetical protein
MKKTTKDSKENKFYGAIIETTPNKLKKILGEPQFFCNNGRYKNNICYTCEINNGNIITIYDWKECRQIDMNEIIRFHIGGNNKEDTINAKTELNSLLQDWKLDKQYSIIESC